MELEEFIEKLYDAGWDCPCDAQHTKIAKLWKKCLKEKTEPVNEVPCSDRVMPDADDMESIKASLERECAYSDEEIDDMLKNATFKCHKDGVDIAYTNGAVDKFIYFKKLVHSTEIDRMR